MKLLVILFVLCGILQAGDSTYLAAPLDLGGKKLQSSFGGVKNRDMHSLTQAVERSFPVLVETGEGTPPPEPSKDVGYAQIIENGKKGQAEVLGRYRESLKASLELRRARLAGTGAHAITAAPTSPTATPTKVQPYSAKSGMDFCTCAKNALKMLKLKRWNIEMDRALEAFQIEAMLSRDRGNGEIIATDGIACGAHLGSYGFSTANPDLEIQILAALTKPATKDETKVLWKYFTLFGAPNRREQVEEPAFWQFAWKRVAFHWILTKTTPPEPQALVPSFIEATKGIAKTENAEITFSLSRETIDAAVTKDWKQMRLPEEIHACEESR